MEYKISGTGWLCLNRSLNSNVKRWVAVCPLSEEQITEVREFEKALIELAQKQQSGAGKK